MKSFQRGIIHVLILAIGLPVSAAWAQLAPPNDAGVTMGHVHLTVADLDAGIKFWVALGGAQTKLGPLDVVKFPGVLIFQRKADPTGASAGSVVNHIGFMVPNLQQSMARWMAAGLKTEPGQNARQGYVYTPDGLVRIEILENASLTVPIAFDHIHFWLAETPGGTGSASEMLAWYAKLFGAKPVKRNQFDGDTLPGVVLLVAKSETPTVPTKGRAIDHIGFEIKNLEAFCKNAEANGIKFDMPYTKRPDLGTSLAFLTDPWGTYIELNEGLDRL